VLIVNGIRVNIANMKIKWLTTDGLITVEDLKTNIDSKVTPKDSILVTFHKAKMSDSDFIKGNISDGDIIDIQLKVNFNQNIEYVSNNKQMVLDVMFTIYSKAQM